MRGHTWQWDGWCSLKIPNNWNVDEEDGIITLARADGVGALQLSFARRQKNEAATSAEAILLAKSFADSYKWAETHPQSITIGGSPTACFEYRETDADDDTYWCVWFVVEERRAALITYTSAWIDRRVEEFEREHIVASFRWTL